MFRMMGSTIEPILRQIVNLDELKLHKLEKGMKE